MFHSGEIRWYFDESLPEDIRSWFGSKGDGKQEPSRTDQYLLLPHCNNTSVKLREGNLEVKANTRRPESVTYTNGVSGYRDAWVKWSCKADDVDALRTMVGATGDNWASVRKSRYLRKYSLDSGSPVEVDAATARPERGCQIEISSISVVVGKVRCPAVRHRMVCSRPLVEHVLGGICAGQCGRYG